VGSQDAGALLVRVGAALGLAESDVAAARARLDGHLRRRLQDAAARGLLGDLQRRTAVVGGSAAAVGQARFLAGTLGLPVQQVVITDVPPEERRAALVAGVLEQAGPGAVVRFESSREAIAAWLRSAEPGLIVGSALEESTAHALGAAHLEAATPLWRSPVLGRSHAGVRGAVALTEALIAAQRAAPGRSAPGEPARPAAALAAHP
jgi:nitrogenase molybdenum-iron protein beta chain